MILIVHIIIALLSLVFSSITAMLPSLKTLKVSYILASGTLVSGVVLMIMQPVSIVHACISGMVYLTAVGAILAYTRRKLSLQLSTIRYEK